MNIFQLEDYRDVLREKIGASPKKGHGQIQKMAKLLNVSPSQVSQVLNGSRHLSESQGLALAKYFHFSDLETEFFIGLVQIAKVDHEETRIVLKKNLKRITDQSPNEPVLDRDIKASLEETEQLKFYSNWLYMAVWLLTSIPGYDTLPTISRHLNTRENYIKEILDFLVQSGLCEEKMGKYKIGVSRTLVTKGSPMLSKHHMNWRLKAIEGIQVNPHDSLFYTSPMTVSKKDALMIRTLLLRSISGIDSIVGPSPAEKAYCVNIDFFEII